MRIAFCIRGFHYKRTDDNLIDYELALANYKAFLFDELNKYNIEYDIFISTYHSDKEDKLENDYKPVKIIYQENNQDNYKALLQHNISLIDMVKDYATSVNIKYDLCIITRFDLVFFKKFSEMNIDINKFNIAMQHSSGNADADFWIFPCSYLDEFRIVQIYMINNKADIIPTTHATNRYIHEDFVHYMYSIDQTDYDNLTCYQYFYFNDFKQRENYTFKKVVTNLNKFKHTTLTSAYLKVDIDRTL